MKLTLSIILAGLTLLSVSSAGLSIEPLTQTKQQTNRNEPVQTNGFLIAYDGCKKVSEEPLVCKVKIKNVTSEPRDIEIQSWKTRIIDGNGVQIDASSIRFAGEAGSSPRTDAPSNIVMTAEIIFNEFPQSGIQYLGVGFRSFGTGLFEVGFE